MRNNFQLHDNRDYLKESNGYLTLVLFQHYILWALSVTVHSNDNKR